MQIKEIGFFPSPYSKVTEKGVVPQTEGAGKSGKSAFQGSVNRVLRTDKIELSARREAEPSDRFLSDLKDSIREEIGRDAGADRLQYLKNAVGNGSYGIDSGTLAKALLSDGTS